MVISSNSEDKVHIAYVVSHFYASIFLCSFRDIEYSRNIRYKSIYCDKIYIRISGHANWEGEEMSTMNNDDICTCGSGLLSKRCCKNNKIIHFNPYRIDHELENLASEWVAYAMTNYETRLIQSIIQKNEHIFIDMSEDVRDYYVGIMVPYQMIHHSINGQKTAYDLFSQIRSNTITNRQVKDRFSKWPQAHASLFEVTKIIDEEQSIYQLLDCHSKQFFKVQYDENPVELGQYLVGTLLPYANYHSFLMAVLQVPAEQKDLMDRILWFLDWDDPEYFSEIVLTIITSNEQPDLPFDFIDPLYEQVADLFIEKNHDEDINLDDLTMTLIFWEAYSTFHMPQVKKPAAYAASLDYFMRKYLSMNQKITQAEIAKKYGTSAGAISNHYQKFIDAHEEFELADRKSVV